MTRDESLALLRATHEFPGPFPFRVLVAAGGEATTIAAMIAAAGESARTVGLSERASRTGKYKSVALTLHVDDAERVLDVYAVLGTLEHVLLKL